MTFHSVGNVIIPTDFHSIIFQRDRSTTNQFSWDYNPFITGAPPCQNGHDEAPFRPHFFRDSNDGMTITRAILDGWELILEFCWYCGWASEILQLMVAKLS